MKTDTWYIVEDSEQLETPGLLFYYDRIVDNIDHMIEMVGDVKRLRPHVKTHKSPDIIQIHLDKEIRKFKCATIAEAEMLALAGAPDVLLAYQPAGPNIQRLAELIREYPETQFSCLCDDQAVAAELVEAGVRNGIDIHVFLDLDDGMHRTGIVPGDEALALCRMLSKSEGVHFRGIHVYDGHIRDRSLDDRRQRCEKDFKAVYDFRDQLSDQGIETATIIAGGSPTFPVHGKNSEVEASPGTTILWDKGYGTSLEGLAFKYAALLATRIISKPGENRLCLDLGHKAISAEHQQPALIFGLEQHKLVGHSEEHMVLEVGNADDYQVGDIFYAVPHHICPTVALHDKAYVIRDHQVVDHWDILARKRKITI